MRGFGVGEAVVRRDVVRGRVWSAQALREGVVSAAEHAAVEGAREQALAMIAARGGPFGEAAGWAHWRWPAAWTPPVLDDAAGWPGRA
ncbi:hypothetical protein [Streptomyces sp. NBC_01190]|uniref:hypothetical protein n=1 Tax=Streptomyces sp. NBC_01190 TaxID=2903767 RepID=UPI00386408F3|nr:hypothetical protein OG519_13150 [Streptomyces sp. NBC_01190]